MTLDLTSLKKAINSLDLALDFACSEDKLSGLTENQKDVVRAGVIQNFEFTYELCWKFIQRWLRENRTVEESQFPRTRKELFRLAARHGLIMDPLLWFEYGDVRNLTAHTYDADMANYVFHVAKKFFADAVYLLKQLELHND